MAWKPVSCMLLAAATLLPPTMAQTGVATAPAVSAPRAACAGRDDDGDGVDLCEDACPASRAGQAIGPDGCPVPLKVELKGVTFDAGRDALRPDAIALLDEAIAILGKYPQLRVEVAGHTDPLRTDADSQALSERRARAVYDYLTSHGIDAARLSGPTGYGASRPLAPEGDANGSGDPAGGARNDRVELVILG